ncbi:MAG: SprT-like domain-containing protein, partial [Rhodobacteraceae bacterium]|nr:SprT-like domain-containing protein [Paracoccaceae bacterium]
MGRHGLHGWTFCFSSTQRRLGKCNYKRQIIDVSLRHAVLDQTAEVTDTILHEIAHALAGPEAGHGPVWKKIAVRLNALPKSRAPESAEAAEAARCSRAQFEAGDSVRFVVKGTEKIGRIVRMNPKRAKVQTRDLRLWTVDYRLLSHTGQQGMR